jgi:transcriptional regulator with XRE-family HTH domain
MKVTLHQKTGFGRQTIDRWLAGERIPDLDQLEQIAGALDVSPLDLIGPELPSLNAQSVRAPLMPASIVASQGEGLPNTPGMVKDALMGRILAALPALDETQLKHLLAIVRALPLTHEPPPERRDERKQKS